MTATFDNYSGLCPTVRPHFTVLEDWIGHLDGMDLTRWQGEGENMHGIDEGTIDTEEAVTAVNALAAEIVRLTVDNARMAKALNERDSEHLETPAQ